MNAKSIFRIIPVLLVMLVLSACQSAEGQIANNSTSGLSVWLDQPPDGSHLPLAPFTLKAHASDMGGSGVQKIEFLVNSISIGAVETDPTQPLVYAELPWNPAAEGPYQLQAQAFDAASSAYSEIANVCVGDACQQEQALTEEPTQPVTQEVTQPAAQEATTEPVQPNGVTPSPACPLSSVYVADVTIPDGTEFTPGAAFVKTWRIKNDGCSPWPDGTKLVFSGGEQMGGETSVPAMMLPPGNTQDFSVNLTAPGSAGPHSGYWQLQLPDGSVFGDRVFVRINVVTPSATEPPTEPPTAPPSSDKTPPDISNISIDTKQVVYGSTCSPNDPAAFTISASISDPSGVGAVRLFYRYVSSVNSAATAWKSRAMSGGGAYSATVNIDSDFIYNALQGANGTVEYYITATDGVGNEGSSPHMNLISLFYCIG